MIRIIIALLFLWPVSVFAETITVPHDHFLGLSPPCSSVSTAREKALHDVAAQVIRSIGANFSVKSSTSVTGSVNQVRYSVNERVRYSASGFIQEIQRRIVDESYERTASGILYQMLVHFPASDIEDARRLSLGSKVHAVWVDDGLVELREVNGIPVVLTEYRVHVQEQNHHADFLNYYVMKVSSGNTRESTKALPKPVILKKGVVKRVRLMVPNQKKTGFRDVVLGTRRSVKVTILGRDSVGRPVSCQVREP